MTAWIHNAAKSPSIGIRYWNNRGGSGRDSSFEHGCGIRDDEQHAHRAAAQRWGTEILVFRGLFGDPEGGAADVQLSDAATFDPKKLGGAEGSLVKLEG